MRTLVKGFFSIVFLALFLAPVPLVFCAERERNGQSDSNLSPLLCMDLIDLEIHGSDKEEGTILPDVPESPEPAPQRIPSTAAEESSRSGHTKHLEAEGSPDKTVSYPTRVPAAGKRDQPALATAEKSAPIVLQPFEGVYSGPIKKLHHR